MEAPFIWHLRSLKLQLERPLLMGVLNLTPDSFSDGGLHADPAEALRRAGQIASEGADLLDIGAESTRPGAAPVEPAEEWRRLEPVLRALGRNFKLPISVDTRHGEVARRALQLGVEVINDVSNASDPALLAAVAEAGSGYVLMHSRGQPATMMDAAVYDDLLGELRRELGAGLERARSAGIAEDRIVLDPGFGFAKTPAQSWELLSRLAELQDLGRPLLVGLSRKRMIRECVGQSAEALAAASAVAAGLAAQRGARILRVHDVAATRAVLQVLQKTGLIP
ncbi:MAG TPA: dihydropteroate synthase [bacterium]|nr:dihydropteroate synthase [bacterium]